MKIAIIADIHSNARALFTVLDSARRQQADALLVAGDIIGYYFEPSSVVQLLWSWERPMFVVKGNHEEMLHMAVMDASCVQEITRKYGPGMRLAMQQLRKKEVDWLLNLPHPLWVETCGVSVLLCHGSPWDINQYLYPDTPFPDAFKNLGRVPNIMVAGHTHYPMVRTDGLCMMVNPGSVGQPRNGRPGAHWLLLDTKSMRADPRCESYDIDSLKNECINLAPNHPYLAQVLTRS